MPGGEDFLCAEQPPAGGYRVQRSRRVPADFHPRKTACVKTYEYRILNREFELPAYRMNTYFFRRKLDVERMKAACPYFLGEHDSRASAASIPRRRPQCGPSISLEVEEQKLSGQGRLICIRVTGNGFLDNMVRILAGTLIQTGLGAYAPEDMPVSWRPVIGRRQGLRRPRKGLTLVGNAVSGVSGAWMRHRDFCLTPPL